jgi:hypothetical protein
MGSVQPNTDIDRAQPDDLLVPTVDREEESVGTSPR